MKKKLIYIAFFIGALVCLGSVITITEIMITYHCPM